MKIVVITDEKIKEELLAQKREIPANVVYIQQPEPVVNAAAYIDLLYQPETERIQLLNQFSNIPVIINNVTGSLKDMPENFIRLNGWSSFLKRPVAEVVSSNDQFFAEAKKILDNFEKSVIRVPDTPGMTGARVVSMIINEAWLSLEEGVSDKEAIDTAMKLGTNYPYGPFEWGEIIGLKKIVSLLEQLAITDPRYQPSALLKKESLAS